MASVCRLPVRLPPPLTRADSPPRRRASPRGLATRLRSGPCFGALGATMRAASPEPWMFDPLGLGSDYGAGSSTPEGPDPITALLAAERRRPLLGKKNESLMDTLGDFFRGQLPGKLALAILLLIVSRVGVYYPLPGVDREAFTATLQQGGLLGYLDTLSGGSLSKVGVFSLGIVPFINASIVMQLLASAIPSLERLQKEEGEAGRKQYKRYERQAAFAFAAVQAVGQVVYLRPFVPDYSPAYLVGASALLTGGAMLLVYIGDTITDLKVGNGTSLLIYTSIVSALPASVQSTIDQAAAVAAKSAPAATVDAAPAAPAGDAALGGVAGALAALGGAAGSSPLAAGTAAPLTVFFAAFFLLTAGIVTVQLAERRLPLTYSAYVSRESYLPFQINASGVMPVIFASTLLAAPAQLTKFSDSGAVLAAARALSPDGALYIPANVALIAAFSYFYTFLQLDPKDVAEKLKRQGAAVVRVRPGRATRDYLRQRLEYLSLFGAIFLGTLSLAPVAVEGITHLTAFRGFAGTSVLILVGVATDTAKKVRTELVMQKYSDSMDSMM